MEKITEFKQFCGFLKKNKWAVLLSVCFSVAAFAFMLTHYNLTIDEETWVGNTGGSTGWLSQGRFGIWLLNLLIAPGGSYVPVLWDWLAVVIWCLSAPLFLYTLKEYFPRLKGWHVFLFCALFTCVPFATGELLSYSMFNLQMSIAMLAVGFTCWFSMRYRKTGRKRYLIPAMLLLVFSVSVYQSFVTVYITWCCACLLLEVLEKKQGGYGPDYKRWLLFLIVAILAAVIYQLAGSLLNHFLVPGSAYLSETYIGWLQEDSMVRALFLAVANVVRVSFAIDIMDHPIYAGAAICITTCAFLAAMVYRIVKASGGKRKLHLFLTTVFVVVAPFSLFIALGSYNTQGRSLIALALLGAIQWLVVIGTFSGKKYSVLLPIIAAALLCYNAVMMNWLFYGSHQVYLCDRAAAQEVMDDIEEAGVDPMAKPLVFVGMYDTHPDVEYPISGSTGGSFFRWDDGNVGRIINFLIAEGHAVTAPSPGEVASAAEAAQGMPDWPEQGSIVETDEYIVVRLSAPTEKWYAVNGLG